MDGLEVELYVDLKKEKASQFQKIAIEDEVARAKAAGSRRQLIVRMKGELGVFAEEARTLRSERAAEELSSRYTKWLEIRQLLTWKRNFRLINKWGDPWHTQPFSKSAGGFGEIELNQAKVNELEADIRGTDIPDETDIEFPW